MSPVCASHYISPLSVHSLTQLSRALCHTLTLLYLSLSFTISLTLFHSASNSLSLMLLLSFWSLTNQFGVSLGFGSDPEGCY